MTNDNLESELEEIFGLCGCGKPDLTLRLALDVALIIYNKQRSMITYEQQQQQLLDLLHNETIIYTVLYWLDNSGLLEHGSGIRGSWIDWGDGEKILHKLIDYNEYWLECNHNFTPHKDVHDGCCWYCGYHKEYIKQELTDD